MVVGLNIFLWMVLGFAFSKVLYFVMVILQFIAVCFVVILWVSILVFWLMLTKSYLSIVNA